MEAVSPSHFCEVQRQHLTTSALDIDIDSGNSDIATAFPNLAKVAAIENVLPVTTATVERSFSAMKLIKTILRSRLGADELEHTMRVCIEGPNQLSDDFLESVIDHYKSVKKRKLALQFN